MLILFFTDLFANFNSQKCLQTTKYNQQRYLSKYWIEKWSFTLKRYYAMLLLLNWWTEKKMKKKKAKNSIFI
jgi:hypothetical protein